MANDIKRQSVGKGSTKISTQQSKFDRSGNYRYNFLKKRKGLFHTGIYCCSYCGRLIGKHSMVVDHCIPVNAAKTSVFIRNYVRFMNMFQDKQAREQGINATWNLVPACDRCNSKKSDKRGLWVVRGVVGRYLFPALWCAVTVAAVVTFLQFLALGTGPWVYITQFFEALGQGLGSLRGVF